MKLETNVAYICSTEKIAKEILKQAEREGYHWMGGEKPTTGFNWNEYGKYTYCIMNKDNFIVYGNILNNYGDPFAFIPIKKVEEYTPRMYRTTIVVKSDGKTVTAFSGKYRGIAKCSPQDEFDIEIGTKLAIDRLFKSIKEQK